MEADKVRRVLALYKAKFGELGIGKIDYPHDKLLDTTENGLAHCHGMLDKMEEFIMSQNRMDKVNRWLGFTQGNLWAARIYMMEDLKEHNRKDSAI